MKFEEYREQTKRTLPDMGSVILNSVHMVLGMSSELTELITAIEKEDRINVGEELTDIAWYVSNYCNIRNISLKSTPEASAIIKMKSTVLPLNPARIDRKVLELTRGISELTDYDKKEFAYQREETSTIKAKREYQIEFTIFNLNKLYPMFGLDAEVCMRNNIDKLRSRYPDKFDADKALNRNLDLERIELEKGEEGK